MNGSMPCMLLLRGYLSAPAPAITNYPALAVPLTNPTPHNIMRTAKQLAFFIPIPGRVPMVGAALSRHLIF
jgi:hypothetical protein